MTARKGRFLIQMVAAESDSAVVSVLGDSMRVRPRRSGDVYSAGLSVIGGFEAYLHAVGSDGVVTTSSQANGQTVNSWFEERQLSAFDGPQLEAAVFIEKIGDGASGGIRPTRHTEFTKYLVSPTRPPEVADPVPEVDSNAAHVRYMVESYLRAHKNILNSGDMK